MRNDGVPRPRLDGVQRPHFVVQIHDARRMHFDFRLEVDGVLKSWAVPRGPSENPSDRRLAVETEDHPLEYREFEGVIPHGESGSGTVIVWDQGTYEPLGHDQEGEAASFSASLALGHATFWLHGAKLHGEFALTRFRVGDEPESGGQEAWLLIKANDRLAVRDRPGSPDPYHARSARTGRTLHQVAVAAARGDGD
ncbi:DNA polymerase ligase N-terminal domain-containing protein [Streptomyces sp. 2R]|uniref:DNA polymerase ligase N-terminal domain-containing protein n=1 Tax=Streptomyces sp. 2R TaxID=1883452 RepID=UPI000B916A78|nr:DNA polymerase ligase N-terminal domain-containing protein [Streptomyces sp. 2R]MBK3588263.1 3'-phosphoesterase [Streptomyces sp. MBT57]OXY95273.1 3'-phosphoesterase [Streptomyces sp. 2R]